MLWNLLGLQRKLDALFDDGWIQLALDCPGASGYTVDDLLDEAAALVAAPGYLACATSVPAAPRAPHSA